MNKQKLQELIDLLIEGNFVTQAQINDAQIEVAQKSVNMEEALVNQGSIKDDQIGQLIADVNNWEYINLRQEKIDESIVRLLPEKFARKQKLIAFRGTEDGIYIALNDPGNIRTLHLIQKKIKKNIIPFYATSSDIEEKFSVYKVNIKEAFDNLLKQKIHEKIGGNAENSSIVKIVNLLIEHGFNRNASDIHIEPQEEETLIRFRIDGIMHDIIYIPREIHELLITRIKVMCKLRTDEHNIPQDGKLKFEVYNNDMDVRISLIPTIQNEKVVMRLLTSKSRLYGLEGLGLSPEDYKKLASNIHKPWGMILVTGPTGSGKTTTLYSILKKLNKREINITTIEDPVEYNINGITQIQVNPGVKLTFASGLRSIVRQDPDVIMVGEIRDSETADIAINSALTGHLVLSTLHTNDAPTTLPRLLDMKIEPFLVSSTVNMAIGQRLVRKICSKCIQSKETEIKELEKKLPKEIIKKITRGIDKGTVMLFEGTGCPICHNSGFIGRVGVFEILEIDEDIGELIMANKNADTIRRKAIEKGMTTMIDDAVEKVLKGVTTIDEMIRIIKS